ncbi:hotdog fold thioesterase [Bacillus aquiflavi]|uniref:hotdog fold thioesterase n=1 Tax=Bacillus aquiflavi TaxID=2672567 RepID=UPI00223B9B4F|nr:hotdog fold thioesterase [Bacillus aquiflavi]
MGITNDLLNIHDTVNGGVIFSLADIAFAIASNTYDQIAVGINANINFIEAVKLDDHLEATAREISKNQRLGLYHMEVKNKQGQLVATAGGTVYRKKNK